MLKPTLSLLNEHLDTLTFTLENVDKSIANSLRRIMLSDIDTYSSKTIIVGNSV